MKRDIRDLDIKIPSPEEVLAWDFNLLVYVQQQASLDPEKIDIEDLMFNHDDKDDISCLDHITDEYEAAIEGIIWDYKNDLYDGDVSGIYNDLAIEAAEKFMKKKRELELLQIENERAKDYESSLSRIDEIYNNQDERIKRFKMGEISVKDLYFNDLNKVSLDFDDERGIITKIYNSHLDIDEKKKATIFRTMTFGEIVYAIEHLDEVAPEVSKDEDEHDEEVLKNAIIDESLEEEKRLQRFKDGDIDFRSLHFSDLDKIPLDKKTLKTLYKLRRFIAANSKSSDSLEEKLKYESIYNLADSSFGDEGRER